MTEKEKQTIDKFEKFIIENELSADFFVSILKHACFYGNLGSASHHSEINKCSSQHIRRTYRKESVNGVVFYFTI